MSTIYQYPANLGDGDSQPGSIQFQWYTRATIQNSNPGDTVVLYMPKEAMQPSTTSWDQQSFGILGRGAYDYARGFNHPGMTDAAERAGVSAVNSAAQRVFQKFGANVSADQLEDFESAVTGQLQNPYLTMIFRGVDFRKFQFQFQFTPFSPGDAKTIFNIIQSFRANSLPTHSAQSAFLGYPSECEIQYLWQGKPNSWLNKFKRAVCTKVDVNYTAQGMWAAMRDGFPASIVMNVEFTELDIVTADDIQYATTNAGPAQQSY